MHLKKDAENKSTDSQPKMKLSKALAAISTDDE
jgi:hypothetical protein